jgi:DinB family protein
MTPRIALLLRALDQAYDHKAWHGPTLRGALRGVTPEQAAWRPATGRHNVWELAVHAAYWKYVVLRRLRGDRAASFPLSGSNWFPRPEELTERAWKADLKVLGDLHRELRAAVAAYPEAALDRAPEGTRTPAAELILGGAFHDLYHAGQVQLLKRLQGAPDTGSR